MLDYGVTAQMLGQPITPLLNGIVAMRFGWVRQPVRWAELEPDPGDYNWGLLDAVVEEAGARGVRLLLVVEGTPGWARPAGVDPALDGPPADLGTLSTFVLALAGRYAGRVAGYQIWRDPHVPARWETAHGGSSVNPAEYVQLLQVAFEAIKSVAPTAVVVTADLCPTAKADHVGYADGLLAAGAATWADALGVCLEGAHNAAGDYSLYLAQALPDYAGIPLWLTRVRWNCPLGDPSQQQRVCEEQQATFLIGVMQAAAAHSAIQVAMVDNFNLSTVAPADYAAGYSLMRADWSARPAFVQLARYRQDQDLMLAGIDAPVLGRNRAPQSYPKPYARRPALEGIADG